MYVARTYKITGCLIVQLPPSIFQGLSWNDDLCPIQNAVQSVQDQNYKMFHKINILTIEESDSPPYVLIVAVAILSPIFCIIREECSM